MKRKRTKAETIVLDIVLGFCFVLLININQSPRVFAQDKNEQCKIGNIYFSENNSLIINTQNKSNLEIQEIKENNPQNFTVLFADAKLSWGLDKKLSNTNLDAEFKQNKDNQVELNLYFKDPKNHQISSRTILEGSAYEIYAETKENSIVENFENKNSNTAEEFNLQVSKSEKTLNFANYKSNAEDFLNELDPKLAESLLGDSEFIKHTFTKFDSITLSQIGDSLIELGLYDEAYQAYRNALKLDGHNSQAQLGVAKTSSDKEERLAALLNTFDSKALIDIGEQWFETGVKNYDSKQIAQAFIPFQFAILKEPKNPEMRFAYATMLEKAGFDFYEEASKRYLEAAALTKDLYQGGDLKVENLMRKSAENLIRVVCYLGKQEQAIKYCNSYLNLGFDRFIDGRPILGLVKEIRYNRNPFLKS